MVAFIKSRNLELLKTHLKLADFLFAVLNLNKNIQKKKFRKSHILWIIL